VPSASVRTATAVNPGVAASCLSANRMLLIGAAGERGWT
jgi:hypothetical protein